MLLNKRHKQGSHSLWTVGRGHLISPLGHLVLHSIGQHWPPKFKLCFADILFTSAKINWKIFLLKKLSSISIQKSMMAFSGGLSARQSNRTAEEMESFSIRPLSYQHQTLSFPPIGHHCKKHLNCFQFVFYIT